MKSPADMKVIQLDITNACSKRCSNCTRFCGHHTKPFFMDFETFKAAVDSMKGFRGIVGIMGGEPTLHPQFGKFVRYYRENIGHDDYSTTLTRPASDFVRHILADAWHVDYSNQRGLWTSVTPKYYEHFELIQDTFGYQLVNDHSNPSMHESMMATRKELGIPDEQWFKMRDACWVQNLWSASITPKGAFFCEVAAAMDATLGGPGGWPIEPGWWKRKPKDFADQLHWCELCSACLPMPKRDANEETDDVSPFWYQKLKEIDSPKLKRGLVNVLNVESYDPNENDVIAERTPYMQNQENRLGKARGVLLPQHVVSAAWFSEGMGREEATSLLSELKALGRLDVVLSSDPSHRGLAEAAGVPFLPTEGCTGSQLLAQLREATAARDWVLLMRDCAPSKGFVSLIEGCVFNPGCLYLRGGRRSGRECGLEFFNIRAEALRQDGDLFDLARSYEARKVVTIKSEDPAHYRLSTVGIFCRRAYKRIHWLGRKLCGQPVPRGPVGEAVSLGHAIREAARRYGPRRARWVTVPAPPTAGQHSHKEP